MIVMVLPLKSGPSTAAAAGARPPSARATAARNHRLVMVPSIPATVLGVLCFHLLVAPPGNDLGHGAVRCAEFQRALVRLRQDGAAILLDLVGERLLISDFDAPMVDPRPGP